MKGAVLKCGNAEERGESGLNGLSGAEVRGC